MSIFDAEDMLTTGLRALEVLARLAPVGLPEFARLARLDTRLSAAMMDVFEKGGYASRLPHGRLYVLTPMAIDLVLAHNPVGSIVTSAVEPVKTLGLTIGLPVTLAIRRGARMRRVLASQSHPDLPVGGRFRMLASVEGQVFAAFSAHRHFGRADAIREAGYAAGSNNGDEFVLAVPVLVEQRSAALIAVHFDSPLDARRIATILPDIQHVAQTLVVPPLNFPFSAPVLGPLLSASLH